MHCYLLSLAFLKALTYQVLEGANKGNGGGMAPVDDRPRGATTFRHGRIHRTGVLRRG